MAESNFVDSLPLGWTMKERIRENGKRDKFYYAPKNGPTFNSRVEVYRYLSGNRIKHYRVKRKKKLALKQPWKIIAVEKVRVENLPPGEIRVKQKNQILRRDSYYTDPLSKTKFSSLNSVHRRLGNDSSISADSIKKQLSVVRRTRSHIDCGQSSAMNEPIEDHQRYCKKLPEKSEVIDSPRRSKRLAGIEVDPIGLKPKTRTCRNKAKQSDNEADHSNGDHSNAVLLGEFLSDPCIAFAIKTLTGLTFEGVQEIRPERVKSEDEKVDENRGEFFPFVGPWRDPCIEFAIKTLTDTARVDYGQHDKTKDNE